MTKVCKITTVILAVATVLLAGVVVRLAVSGGELAAQNREMQKYQTQLENVYEKSFFELADSVRNMQTSLSKLTVANTSAKQQEIIADVIGQADAAQSDLGTLPISSESLRQTAAFANKTCDFCKYLNRKLASGGKMTADDRQNVKDLAAAFQKINDKLGDFCGADCVLKLSDGILNDGVVKGIGDGFDEMSGDGTFEYPKLIYDGPFSDARKDEITLAAKEMTAEEVRQKVMRDLALLHPADVAFKEALQNRLAVFDFDVTLKDGSLLFVQAAKNGGMIAQISSAGKNGASIGKEQAMSRAKSFAKALGFDVEPIWVSKEQGTTYVNLAPVQGGVIIYPDLVKVSLDASGISGFESYSYLANHKTRIIDKMLRDPMDMADRLSPELVVKNTAVALIPKGDGETLCYEYECEADGSQFFVYLNAETGEEEDIFKVVKGTEGYTVM